MPKQFRGARAATGSLAVFILAAMLMLAFMDLRVGHYDEALLLTGAWNVAEGAVPHRDFYANYGPAQFYVIAGLFRVFGPSFLIARIYDVIVRAAIVAIAHQLLVGRVRTPIALSAAGVSFLWLAGSGYYLYPTVPALCFALFGTLLLIKKVDFASGRGLAAAGACTGLVALFRYDVGFYTLGAHLLLGLTIALRQAGTTSERLRAFVGRAFVYVLGTALVFLLPAGLLLLAGAGPGFLHDIVLYPSRYYARMRELPLPDLRTIRAIPAESAVYLPFAATALGGAYLFITGRQKANPSIVRHHDTALVVVLTALCLFFSIKGLVRVSSIHMLLAIVPSTLLLAVLIDRRWLLSKVGRAGLALAVLVGVVAPISQAKRLGSLFSRDPGVTLASRMLAAEAEPSGDIGRVLGPAVIARDTACAANYIAASTRPGERIFSGTGRHDKIFVNNMMIYFASGRLPGTHWSHFDPGLQTRADVQELIIADLRRNRVRWVILDSSWDDFIEPNESAKSSGVVVLDNYLRVNYRQVASFDKITVWLWNGQKSFKSSFTRCSSVSPE